MLIKFVTQRKPINSRLLIGLNLVVASLLLAPNGASANEIITLKTAISKTIQSHPDLTPLIYLQQANHGLIQQAGVASPVTLDVSVEDALGTGDYQGFSNSQTSLSIAWLLDGEQVDARVNLAKQQGLIYAVEKEAKALDLAAETANLFITLLAQQAQLKLATLAEKQAKKALSEIIKRVEVGRVNSIDKYRAKADLAKQTLVVEDLYFEIEATKSQLAAQWQGTTKFDVTGDLTQLPNALSLEDAKAQLKNTPRFSLFASKQRVISSEIALSQAESKPAWQINTGITRDQALNDISLSAGISIPLGGTSRSEGKIASLNASKQQQAAEAKAWLARAQTQALLLNHKLTHNTHIANALVKESLPALETASRQAELAYQQGRYRYTDWYAVKQELIQAQLELIQAYTNIQRFNVELERLTGASLTIK